MLAVGGRHRGMRDLREESDLVAKVVSLDVVGQRSLIFPGVRRHAGDVEMDVRYAAPAEEPDRVDRRMSALLANEAADEERSHLGGAVGDTSELRTIDAVVNDHAPTER